MSSLAYDIGTLLHQVSGSLDKHSDQVLTERLGISLSQFRVLLVLLEEDGQNQSQIAQNLSQSEASISRQVHLLENSKLIEIKKNDTNRRDSLVYLTGKGAMIGQSAMGILNSYHRPVFEDLNDQQQIELARILYRLQSHLDAL